jgi:large subunit ribosomal protein L23
MKDPTRIIYKPLLGEKVLKIHVPKNRFCFWVAPYANKIEIKEAVETLFSIKNKVLKVHTMMVKGKLRRRGRNSGYRPDRKKAIVFLASGATIKALSDYIS